MISIRDLSVELPGFRLDIPHLDVGQGEFFVLIGPTGSGKTLLLESVAGLAPAGRGSVRVAGREIADLPPERRGVSIVYQDNGLFPHLGLMDNVTYGLECRGMPRAEAAERVKPLLERLGLGRLMGRGVQGLSGGEAQRVALARALAVEPDVLLLDEPLSALDPQFRSEVRTVLQALHREMGTTMLMVTHDFAEAMSLADGVAVMHTGRIRQQGAPDEVFWRPDSALVARFVGMKNVFEAVLSDDGDRVCFLGRECPFSGDAGGREVLVGLRPEDVLLGRGEAFAEGVVDCPGRVETLEDLGFVSEVMVRCDGLTLRVILARRKVLELGLVPGADVRLGFLPERLHVFNDSSS